MEPLKKDRSTPNSHYKATSSKIMTIREEDVVMQDKRNIVSATEKEIKVRRVKGMRQETPVLKD